MKGKISHINTSGKGYGFVKNADYPEGLFFHSRELPADLILEDFHVGQDVEFDEVVESEKGYSCRGLRPL